MSATSRISRPGNATGTAPRPTRRWATSRSRWPAARPSGAEPPPSTYSCSKPAESSARGRGDAGMAPCPESPGRLPLRLPRRSYLRDRSCPDAPADRDDEARDQHLFAGADAAGAVWPWAGAALRRGGDRGLSGHRLGARRLSRPGGARGRRGRAADRRRRAAEPTGRRRRVRAYRRHDLRRGGERRFRRHHARPARRDGHREPRGRRGRTPAPHPRDRPDDADRRVARHARQPLRRDHRQRDGRHRLSHLPAYRHLRHRQARRRDPAAGDARRGAGR